MTFTEILALIGSAFRDRGTTELAQRGPTRAREVREVLEAMMTGGNNARTGVKFVRNLYRADEEYGYAVREELDRETCCLGTICYSSYAPTPEEKVTVLVYHENQTDQEWRVYADGQYDHGLVSAKWVPYGSAEAAAAGFRLFNPFDEDGYITGEIVKYVAGNVTQFAEARHDFTLGAYPAGYPAPTDSASNAHWKPVSPPNPTYQPLKSVTYATLLAAQDGSLEPGPLYEITNRPNNGPVVYATFDTDSANVSEVARVSGQPGLFRYTISTNTLEPITNATLKSVVVLPFFADSDSQGEFNDLASGVEYATGGEYGMVHLNRGFLELLRQPVTLEQYPVLKANGCTVYLNNLELLVPDLLLSEIIALAGTLAGPGRIVDSELSQCVLRPNGNIQRVESTLIRGGTIAQPFTYTAGPGTVILGVGTEVDPYCVPDPATTIIDLRSKAATGSGVVFKTSTVLTFAEDAEHAPVLSGTFTVDTSGKVVGTVVRAYLGPGASAPALGADFQVVSGAYESGRELMYSFAVGGNGKIQCYITPLS
ncbi:hypothetical protein [uncultured Hymenobacter sp.]|uniref:hypothetical protein n=1 Tax=uncultured Hymenobacter sp. TaxID=170016 RepID=UPI0035CBE560